MKQTVYIIIVLLIVLLLIMLIKVLFQPKAIYETVFEIGQIETEPIIEVDLDSKVYSFMSEESKTVSRGNYERSEWIATAYCACTKCCGPNAKGITASGTKVQEGRTIAVDTKLIKLGTVVTVNGHEYIAEDTGSAIKGKKIDIYFDSHEDALKWGVRKVEVSY